MEARLRQAGLRQEGTLETGRRPPPHAAPRPPGARPGHLENCPDRRGRQAALLINPGPSIRAMNDDLTGKSGGPWAGQANRRRPAASIPNPTTGSKCQNIRIDALSQSSAAGWITCQRRRSPEEAAPAGDRSMSVAMNSVNCHRDSVSLFGSSASPKKTGIDKRQRCSGGDTERCSVQEANPRADPRLPPRRPGRLPELAATTCSPPCRARPDAGRAADIKCAVTTCTVTATPQSTTMPT